MLPLAPSLEVKLHAQNFRRNWHLIQARSSRILLEAYDRLGIVAVTCYFNHCRGAERGC